MNFEEWFKQQDFYENMMFVHGDRLFDNDEGIYRLLPVRIAHKAWVDQKASCKQSEDIKQDENLKKTASKIHIGIGSAGSYSAECVCLTILVLAWWFKEPISKLMVG